MSKYESYKFVEVTPESSVLLSNENGEKELVFRKGLQVFIVKSDIMQLLSVLEQLSEMFGVTICRYCENCEAFEPVEIQVNLKTNFI